MHGSDLPQASNFFNLHVFCLNKDNNVVSLLADCGELVPTDYTERSFYEDCVCTKECENGRKPENCSAKIE